ncbi:MAG: thiamine pyrophosphate-dependent enzyme, partial [Sphingobacteriales bacterium]
MNEPITNELLEDKLSFEAFREEVLKDYRTACESREASLLGRKEVLTGKAKFGIFGDGKEIPQIAMAKFFKPGDHYSGYYRDQTFAFAIGAATIREFFAQLYADPDVNNDPHSGGRQMNAHFASTYLNENGDITDLVNRKNVSAGMAPTAGQMLRSLGMALTSKLIRNLEPNPAFDTLSNQGDEMCFCTIGDASTSEGHFWETVNAAAVQQVPLAIFVWDDGFGISVPKKYQTTKGSISEALKGFQKKEDTNGILIYKVKAWDYASLCETFEEGIRKSREKHIPVLFHVEEVTQPQGHSTSGSHERYKTPERLDWEREWDCIRKMREWIIANMLAEDEELIDIEHEVKHMVRELRQEAWDAYMNPIRDQVHAVIPHLEHAMMQLPEHKDEIQALVQDLQQQKEPLRRDVMRAITRILELGHGVALPELAQLQITLRAENTALFSTHLFDEGDQNLMQVEGIPAVYEPDAPTINGYEILNKYFDQLFAANPLVFAFGEDLGKIGDVNQGFAGLQEKYGEYRIFDTGIRELTIIGQGIGMSMRGLRPIAEIQYLDYLLYGLQPLSDDVSTLRFRSVGKQAAPIIVRTRGHRLEGIWHSGSPMGMIINALRGMYVCVPRNMVQAAGMYNTLLQGNEPGIVIESLNGYRLKEKLPANLSTFRVAMGVPEILRPGSDVTIVSYGSTLRIVMEAADVLEKMDVDCEVIDVQTLLP